MDASVATADDGREALRARFEEVLGPWAELYGPLLEADPELLGAYLDLCAAAVAGGRLSPLVRELVGLAASASTAHLYEPAVRLHTRNALALGGDPREIVEVLELTSVLGIHSPELGLEVLSEELVAAGGEPPELGGREVALRESFLEGRGMFPGVFEEVLRWDADLLEAYLAYSTIPWRQGTLPAKVREFVYIAIDASTTKLHRVGTRLHIENALEAGATKEEVVEVLELISLIGIHAATVGIPILREEVGGLS